MTTQRPEMTTDYLDAFSLLPQTHQYKTQTYAALSKFDTQKAGVLDMGCGTGVDIPELSKLVGDRGFVVAADKNPNNLEIVRRMVQAEGFENVTPYKTDACATNLPDNYVNLYRADRVYKYISNPKKALREAIRVTERAIVISEPDWSTLELVEMHGGNTWEKVKHHLYGSMLPSGTIGSQLSHLFIKNGLREVREEMFHMTLDFPEAWEFFLLEGKVLQAAHESNTVSIRDTNLLRLSLEKEKPAMTLTFYIVSGKIP